MRSFSRPLFFPCEAWISGLARFARKIRQPKFFSAFIFCVCTLRLSHFLCFFWIHATSVAFLMLFCLCPLSLCAFFIKRRPVSLFTHYPLKATRQAFHACAISTRQTSPTTHPLGVSRLRIGLAVISVKGKPSKACR